MARISHRTAPGCTYFVTTKTWENRSLFQVAGNAEILVEVLLRYRAKGAYLLHEFVIMPNHLHILLTPAESTTLEKAMQLIKGGSSYEIHKRREYRMGIWQAGFFESTIRDAAGFRSKAEYICQNPVKAKLVEAPEEWLYSSARAGFAMDEWPFGFASGAKAPEEPSPIMSELKLRPPKAEWANIAGSDGRGASVAKVELTRDAEPRSKAGPAGKVEPTGNAGTVSKAGSDDKVESTGNAASASKAGCAGRVESTGKVEPTSNAESASKAKAARG